MSEANSVKNPIIPGTKIMKLAAGKGVESTKYMSLISSLMYLTVTRPDLMYVVSLLARFMEKPKEEHMAVAKQVLRYIKGTMNYGLHYGKDQSQKLKVFTDINYARDLENRKSTSGYVCLFSGAAICWSSRKQEVVTLSSTEAEYVAATTCTCHCVWLKGILEEVEENTGTVEVMCDNCSTIKLSKNPIMHRRTKYIDVRFHYIRELVNKDIIRLNFCGTKEQLADMMTKPLSLAAFEFIREEIGVKDLKQEAQRLPV
ncbi:secreted RxLR effector protein 161-like [Lactuca sativa]|uniref:secreted RxLR effector protein 161-like n=1 Tax=Lactuca sativa TaxID=4236 RepID=UPI001C68BA01|nr:secreted RxLR effector protein 161-like [Lactuca sativa]